MICHIIACGPSGKYWNGNGFSIGVNDCFKWGHRTNILIVVNSLNKYPERKKIIEESLPHQVLYGIDCWVRHPSYKRIAYMNHWRGRLDKGKLYKAKTSPFIAVTMAYAMGYDKIVLWGVDFQNHPIVNGQRLRAEVEQYVSLQKALSQKGCSMYLGGTKDFQNDGALAGLIPNFLFVSCSAQ